MPIDRYAPLPLRKRFLSLEKKSVKGISPVGVGTLKHDRRYQRVVSRTEAPRKGGSSK